MRGFSLVSTRSSFDPYIFLDNDSNSTYSMNQTGYGPANGTDVVTSLNPFAASNDTQNSGTFPSISLDSTRKTDDFVQRTILSTTIRPTPTTPRTTVIRHLTTTLPIPK